MIAQILNWDRTAKHTRALVLPAMSTAYLALERSARKGSAVPTLPMASSTANTSDARSHRQRASMQSINQKHTFPLYSAASGEPAAYKGPTAPYSTGYEYIQSYNMRSMLLPTYGVSTRIRTVVLMYHGLDRYISLLILPGSTAIEAT